MLQAYAGVVRIYLSMKDFRSKTAPARTQIIYDGACPICSAYVRHTAYKSTESVNYLDARQCPELVDRLSQQGINLDEGLVVNVNNKTHHGADAMHVLSTMTRRRGIWNRIIATLFATPLSSRLLYPVFRTGRNLLLRLLGRPLLNDHVNDKLTAFTRTLYWVPILSLLLMVANHVYLRYNDNLSPWLGAGFGMFSTTDSVSDRKLVIYGVDSNGVGRELSVPQKLNDEAKRASGLPSSSMLARFGRMMHDHLLQTDCYATEECIYTEYRIEIWRVHYNPQTLLPDGERLAGLVVTVPPHEQS